MWLLWSCISILLFAMCEIFEKKGSDYDDECSESKLLVWFGIFSFMTALVISVSRMRETNIGFINMAIENPSYIVASAFYFLSLLFAFISLKLIPVSIEVPITNTCGILSFAGAILLYTFRGKFNEISSEITAAKLSLVFVVSFTAIVFSILYRNDVSKNDGKRDFRVGGDKFRKLAAAGVIFAVLSAVCDAGNSVVIYYILDEAADSNDYLYFSNMLSAVFGIVSWFYILIKTKKIYNPFGKGQRDKAAGAALDCAGMVTCILAISGNPVLSDPLISSYFVFTVILSRIFLKEKLKAGQYVCVIILAVSILMFGILDT